MAKFKVGDRVRYESGGVVLIATLKRLIPKPELFHGEWDAICDDGDDAIFREDQIELIDPIQREDSTPNDAATLRDQFAMAALTGLCAQSDSTGMWSWTSGHAASTAYEIADAMLAERERAK